MTTLLADLIPSFLKSSENNAAASNDTSINNNPGCTASNQDGKIRLPILIIPGFMSSGLKVAESQLEPEWVGRRLWLDLGRLGMFSSDPTGKTVKAKDHWVQHMMLQPENRSHSPTGIEVRAIPGLDGVDYLDDSNTFTKGVSYVFAPLIAVLKKHGYQERVDLEAASYDWRLPPSELERRDQYFSQTIPLVERLYKQNDSRRVVLLCHSMGCKVGHYFLNFCLDKLGQEWIDRHIHTFFVVGAPHLGSSNTIKGLVCGDKMGLDAFMSEKEALRLARSWGSAPWLVPKELPRGAPPCSFFRPTGRLSITPIWPSFWPNNVKVSVVFGSHVLTKVFRSQAGGKLETASFVFSTDPDQPTLDGEEPFFQIMSLDPTPHDNTNPKKLAVQVATCPIRACCVLPCEKWCRCFCSQQYHVTKQLVAQAIDGSAVLATTGPIHLRNILKDDPTRKHKTPVKIKHPPFHWLTHWGEPKLEEVTLEIHWQPFSNAQFQCESMQNGPAIAAVHPETPTEVFAAKPYQAVPVHPVVHEEGNWQSASAILNLYDEQDPIDPRGRSAWEAPPVRQVKAVYGTQLPTQVGAYYTARPAQIIGFAKEESCYVVDESAELSSAAKKNGYRIRRGILEETHDTPYRVPLNSDGETSWEVRKCSGDGTVPYWSLQHARTWQSDTCQVELNEIEKANHRDILTDERFQKIVLDYCVETSFSVS